MSFDKREDDIIVHLLAAHHDPDLPAGLNGVRFLHAGKAGRDPLELLEPLDVGFEHLPAGARSCSRQGIGGLHDDIEELLHGTSSWWARIEWTIVFGLAVLLGKIGADAEMGAFYLVVDGLADIVEQTGPLRLLDVELQFRRDNAADEGHLKRMLIDVLGVTAPELESAQKLHHLRMDVVDPGVEDGLLAG